MKKFLYISIFLSFFTLASGNQNLLLEGVKSYEKKEYEKALHYFLKAKESGLKNGKLYYNIGNSYFKLGKKGLSILWYERAKKFIPNDPDLKFNLDYLSSFVEDEEEEENSLFYNVLFFWKKPFNSKSIQYIALTLNLILFSILTLNLLFKKYNLKYFAFIVALFSTILTLTAFYDFTEERRYGVILSEQAVVRSGFSEDSTKLFELHEGSKVKIEKETEKFYKVLFDKDKIGWIGKNFLGLI